MLDLIFILNVKNPFHIVILVLTTICIVKSLRILKQLLNKQISTDVKKQLDYLLILGLTVFSTSILAPFIGFVRAIFSIQRSGTGDPRVIFPGLFEALAHSFFYILLGSLIILIWSILNFYKKSFDKT